MTEPRIHNLIALALAERQLIDYGGSPAGGGTWHDMAFLATLVVLREWGIDPEGDEPADMIAGEAVNVAIDRISQRIPLEVRERLLADEPLDRPRRSGRGAVGYAADQGLSTVRRCPRCNTPIYKLSKSASAIARGVPGPLWISIDGRASEGRDGVIEIRPVPVLDRSSSRAGYVDPEGVAWPQREIETLYRPPLTVRCHGGNRTLSRDQRGQERCGAVLRIDGKGEASLLSENGLED